jgi:AraC-like DNA-binding protein
MFALNSVIINEPNIADYAFTTLAWPLLFLYFKSLSYNKQVINLKSDLKHLVLPIFLFILVCFKSYLREDVVITLTKLGVPIVAIYTLGYCFWSYSLLKNNLWKKKSTFKPLQKKDIAIRKWSKFLFFLFTLILIRFLVNPIINQEFKFFSTNNNFLAFGALMWIVVYVKLLTSPEFLFGYEVFQDKINKYKIDFIVFDNQWNKTITDEITNKKDLVLKETINSKYIEYIETIEHISQNNKLFFKQGIKVTDLANKMKIPKSHVVFIFKYYSKINFTEFKRNIRIKKAIQLMQDGYLTSNIMESLSEEIGFSTYSSFFKNFKETTGISPLEYFQKVKGEVAK